MYPDWFSSNTNVFKKFLNHYFDLPNLKFLQIGAYTGDASLWLLKNILINNSSILIDVDTWQGSEEGIHKKFDWSDVESTYDKKVSDYTNIIKYKTTSTEYLSNCLERFDFIYIDGDHTADGVYSDAILSFPLLKDKGIMAFDDYLWHHESNNPILEPKNGIDKFLSEQKDSINTLHMGYQVWIEKV
jgi:hypothetical protein